MVETLCNRRAGVSLGCFGLMVLGCLYSAEPAVSDRVSTNSLKFWLLCSSIAITSPDLPKRCGVYVYSHSLLTVYCLAKYGLQAVLANSGLVAMSPKFKNLVDSLFESAGSAEVQTAKSSISLKSPRLTPRPAVQRGASSLTHRGSALHHFNKHPAPPALHEEFWWGQQYRKVQISSPAVFNASSL